MEVAVVAHSHLPAVHPLAHPALEVLAVVAVVVPLAVAVEAAVSVNKNNNLLMCQDISRFLFRVYSMSIYSYLVLQKYIDIHLHVCDN